MAALPTPLLPTNSGGTDGNWTPQVNRLPVLLKDGYKVGHIFQYPDDTTMVYSNMTARSSRTEAKKVVAFGMQYFVQEYLIRQFNENFFKRPKEEVLKAYERRIGAYLGPITVDHIGALHDLQYLPLHIKAVPEGSLVPLRVPILTLYNTRPEFYWLTNMVETLLSNILWLPMTSATTAAMYRAVFDVNADVTGGDKSFVPWQGHDFSFRGMAGVEAAELSGAAHLLSFTGTDTIPAIDFLEEFYGADCEAELIAGSVPATEHSVMSMGGKTNELETIRRLLKLYPTGVLSIVCDTWDFWKVLTEYLPELEDEIRARDGKLVVRPDSGDPVKIICGDPEARGAVHDGAIQTLWNNFGGTETEQHYKVLDSHVGLIYGDSISLARQEAILKGLMAKGFASTNVVLGIGSYTYQYVTRDTYGFAVKATYGETRSGGAQAIFKNPATDDGVKRSATGLLQVYSEDGALKLKENCTWEEEGQGELRTIFRDGAVWNKQPLSEIRARLEREKWMVY